MLEIRASKQHFLGMPVEEFLRDYWQKKPLLIRQALPNYQAPLAPEDLAGLACEETALSRLVQHDRKHDAWRVRSGPFDEAEIPTLGDRDWTLLVQDMDKVDADVPALLDHFRFLPAWRVDDIMISFATKGGSVGPHVDQYDVFLLQAMGQRRWQIDVDPRAPREFREDVELKLLRKFTPSNEWVLDPGDMLYLPPGVPHHGEAVDACMTFSVGMRAPSRAELLVDLAEELAGALPEEARYADPDLAEPRDAFEIDDAAFARVDQALSNLANMDAKSRRRWFGRFITRYRSAGEIMAGEQPPTLANGEKEPAHGRMLQRHPFARSAWTKQGKEALLFVDGECWQMDARSAHVLAAYEAIDDAALAKLSDSGRDALASLLRRGHYQLRKATRSRR